MNQERCNKTGFRSYNQKFFFKT